MARVAQELDCYWPKKKMKAKPTWRLAGLASDDWVALLRLLGAVVATQPLLLGYYIKTLYACARANPAALQSVGIMVAFYLHLGPFSRVVSKAIAKQIDEIDSGSWRSPLASIETGTTGEDFLRGFENRIPERYVSHSSQ